MTLIRIYRIPKVIQKKTDMLDELLSRTSITNYDKLPGSFKKLSKWPEKTNLQCASCGCTTNRRPFFIPLQETDNGEFLRGGNPMVCSPNCAVFMAKIRITDKYKYNSTYKMIVRLSIAMTGILCNIISMPEDPVNLEKYGGSITDGDYQKKIFNLNSDIIGMLYVNKEDLIKEIQS